MNNLFEMLLSTKASPYGVVFFNLINCRQCVPFRPPHRLKCLAIQISRDGIRRLAAVDLDAQQRDNEQCGEPYRPAAVCWIVLQSVHCDKLS